MQTFLPVPDYGSTALCLDDRRLSNQRGEAKVILRVLLGVTDGWQHHPAVQMWHGYERSLAEYASLVCVEWRERGGADSLLPWFCVSMDRLPDTGPPPWLGDAAFHASHRSNLLRKDPGWYGRFGWTEPDDLPYVWPKPTDRRLDDTAPPPAVVRRVVDWWSTRLT